MQAVHLAGGRSSLGWDFRGHHGSPGVRFLPLHPCFCCKDAWRAWCSSRQGSRPPGASLQSLDGSSSTPHTPAPGSTAGTFCILKPPGVFRCEYRSCGGKESTRADLAGRPARKQPTAPALTQQSLRRTGRGRGPPLTTCPGGPQCCKGECAAAGVCPRRSRTLSVAPVSLDVGGGGEHTSDISCFLR